MKVYCFLEVILLSYLGIFIRRLFKSPLCVEVIFFLISTIMELRLCWYFNRSLVIRSVFDFTDCSRDKYGNCELRLLSGLKFCCVELITRNCSLSLNFKCSNSWCCYNFRECSFLWNIFYYLQNMKSDYHKIVSNFMWLRLIAIR